MRKIQQFLLNAVILTATSLVMNGISVWYSLYITNRIGAETMGVFQLMMSVYGFGITLATSGINLAATRLVAEEIGRARPQGVRRAMVCSLGYSLAFGLAAGGLLFAFAGPISRWWLGRAEVAFPLRVMAAGLPMIAVSSALSGYFTAVRRVYKNASVQILEQLLKIFLTMAALSMVFSQSLQSVCLALAAGSIISEAASCLVSWLLYLRDRRRFSCRQPAPALMGKLLYIALPVAMSTYLRSGLMTLKNLLVPLRLRAWGMTESAAFTAFGLIHGVVLPVVLFPTSLLYSFTGLMVPELAECHARSGDPARSVRIQYLIGRMLQMTLIFSIGVAAALLVFADEIGLAFCRDPGAVEYLQLFALIVPIMYLDNAVDSVLKGLNEQLSSMRYNVIDALVSVILVYTLLPVRGVAGYLFILCLSECLNFVLSYHRLLAVTGCRVFFLDTVFRPSLCAAAAAWAVWLLQQRGAFLPWGAAGQACLMILLFLCGYLLVLMASHTLSTADQKWLISIFRRGGR